MDNGFRDIALPESTDVVPENCLFVEAAIGGIVTIPEEPLFSLTIEPDSVTFTDGSTSGLVCATLLTPDSFPIPVPPGLEPGLIVVVQADPGVFFDPPAPFTIPNADGLPPGHNTFLFSFDHDLGVFDIIGTGTVSGDGSMIVSDPGFGITKSG